MGTNSHLEQKLKKKKKCVWCVARHKKTETITTNKGHQLPVVTKTNIKYLVQNNKKKITEKVYTTKRSRVSNSLTIIGLSDGC